MSHSEITLREITRMVSGAAHSHEIMDRSDSRLPRDYTLDARDLALEIWRARTREIARDVTSLWLVVDTATDELDSYVHSYAPLCNVRPGWLVLTAAPASARRDSPSVWRVAPRRDLSLASAPPTPSVAQTQCARARATYTPSRWRVRFVGTRWSARDVGEARTVAVEARTAIERRPRERERARLRSIKDQPAERGHGVVACAVRGDELW